VYWLSPSPSSRSLPSIVVADYASGETARTIDLLSVILAPTIQLFVKKKPRCAPTGMRPVRPVGGECTGGARGPSPAPGSSGDLFPSRLGSGLLVLGGSVGGARPIPIQAAPQLHGWSCWSVRGKYFAVRYAFTCALNLTRPSTPTCALNLTSSSQPAAPSWESYRAGCWVYLCAIPEREGATKNNTAPAGTGRVE
jgi:hypothetical protein